MDKKGISPLIATILLLILAVILGLVVMTWGRGEVEGASRCPVDSGLKIVDLNGVPEICYAGSGEDGYIHFIVENGPTIDLDGIQMTVIGTKKVYNMKIKRPVQASHSLLKDIPHNFDEFGDIRQIKLYPRIVVPPSKESIICTEQAIVIDELRSC